MQFSQPTNVKVEEGVNWDDRALAHREFHNAVTEVYEGAQDLLIRKHRDYGSKNISTAPGGALNGLVVRMHDKLARLSNLRDKAVAKGSTADNAGLTEFESIRDTLVDLANYALIGVLVVDGDWPE